MKIKKIAKMLIDILMVVIFLASAVVLIASLNQKKTGISGAFGYSVAIVQTDSMSGTMEAGDLVIGKLVGADTTIREGDIITYKDVVNSQWITITHRVSAVEDHGNGVVFYQTWGDNREMCYEPDAGYRTMDDIVSVHSRTLPGVGRAITFLKTPVGFILCLVLPLLLFIVYEVYSLIRIYVTHKKEEMLETAGDETSDALKEAIIAEYLAKQKAEAEPGGANA